MTIVMLTTNFRNATIPKEIELGETWILLAHKEAGTKTVDGIEEKVSAIFYAFRPTRIIKIISPKESKDRELIENLKKRGITPLVGVSDGKGNASETYTLDEWKEKNKGFLNKIFGGD